MEDGALIHCLESSVLGFCSPAFNYPNSESCFSSSLTWIPQAKLPTESFSQVGNVSGQLLTGSLLPPGCRTDLPVTMGTCIMPLGDKHALQGVSVSVHVSESDAQLPEHDLAPHDTQQQDMGSSISVSGSLPQEGLFRASVNTTAIDVSNYHENFQDIQCQSLSTSLSLDSCYPGGKRLSKDIQSANPGLLSVSSLDMPPGNSVSGTYSVQPLFSPMTTAQLQSESSLQLISGNLDRCKQVGICECIISKRIGGLDWDLHKDNNVCGSQSHCGVASASCNNCSVSIGFSSPGTELSLAIASVLDSGADRDSEVLQSSFGLSVCTVNSHPQTVTDGLSIERPVSRKDEMFLKLIQQVRELEVQLQERKEWAHQKAMQAACKFSKDMSELMSLRWEHEEILRLKRETQALEDNTMKRLSEMETALKKASVQVDRANASVRKLETENAELRAEMEAAKLSASESNIIRQEAAKKERKSVKRVKGWEKQKAKLLEEIIAEKQRIAETQQCLSEAKLRQHEAEAKWRQEEKAKHDAALLADAEKWAKEQLEIIAKRREEACRWKADADFQRYKDDIKRLESELGQLKIAAEGVQVCTTKNISGEFIMQSADTTGSRVLREINSRLVCELAELQDLQGDVRRDRECVMCMSKESSVVFLPCAHQIVCPNCSDLHEKQGMRDCPSCRTKIQQRIHVFGVRTM